ncbi:MAG: DUF2851 family protein [Bacteroidaceae bacterium]|nr:DUF2851 family protein [Bacteroidaceae bacterium]
MEQILQYVWQHKIFPIRPLATSDGRKLEILNPGLLNHDSGPDFIGARIKIDDVTWVGNVEVHIKSSDWFRHHHDTNPDYDNIILHVAMTIDRDILYPDGRPVPQMELPIPDHVLDNYHELLAAHSDPRCKYVVQHIPQLLVHNFMSSLVVERLEQRSMQIDERLRECGGDWENVCMITVMRNFGFGLNGDAFERLAYSLPMQALSKHRDDLLQIEALFFGQAGLLSDDAMPDQHAGNSSADKYYQTLRREYAYLRHKFGLEPMSANYWRFLRLRPQNFPHVRIAQLAMMYHERKVGMSRIIEASDINHLYEVFDTHVSTYWMTHYSFAAPASHEVGKSPTKATKDLLIINSVIPLLFAYGKYKSLGNLCEKAIGLLEELRPENNRYVREWKAAGIECCNAGDSQALLHLTRTYCQPHECLRCRFGHEFIRQTPDFLREMKQT